MEKKDLIIEIEKTHSAMDLYRLKDEILAHLKSDEQANHKKKSKGSD